MRVRQKSPFIAIALVFAECSSAGDGSTADSTAVNPPAAAATSTDGAADQQFVEACLGTSNLTRPLCECTARKAKAQLSANGFAHLTATLRREEARAAELRGQLTAEEMMSSGTFMVRGPAECAREAAQ